MHRAQNPLLYLGFPVTVDNESGKGMHPWVIRCGWLDRLQNAVANLLV